MKKFFKWGLLFLVALIFIGTFVFLYQKSRKKETSYQTVSPEVTDLYKSTIVTGKIEPRDEVLIKPQINGIIAEIYKKAGEQIRKDEVIAKVKVIPEMSSLNSAESSVRMAEINLRQTEKDYQRMKNLYEQKLVSEEEFDKARVTLEQNREELRNREDALNIIREGISKSNASFSTTLVRSTIDGLILDIPVKVGNSVIMSNTMNDGTTIASVANMHDLLFKGKIDETEVGKIHEGMPVTLTIGALQDQKFQAVLEYISPKAVETNGTNQFEIEAALRDSSGTRIRSGYSANAEIILDQALQVIALPEGCIEFNGDSTFVYILKQEAPQQFERRQVITGVSDGIKIEVKSGLNKNDRIRGNMQMPE